MLTSMTFWGTRLGFNISMQDLGWYFRDHLNVMIYADQQFAVSEMTVALLIP